MSPAHRSSTACEMSFGTTRFNALPAIVRNVSSAINPL